MPFFLVTNEEIDEMLAKVEGLPPSLAERVSARFLDGPPNTEETHLLARARAIVSHGKPEIDVIEDYRHGCARPTVNDNRNRDGGHYVLASLWVPDV